LRFWHHNFANRLADVLPVVAAGVVFPGVMEAENPRAVVEAVFRERLGPVLAPAKRFPEATEMFIDGDASPLSLDDERRLFGYADFPSLTLRGAGGRRRGCRVRGCRVRARAARSAADLGQHPARPARHLRPAAAGWHADIWFLHTRVLTLDDYVRQGVMGSGQASDIRDADRPRDDGRLRRHRNRQDHAVAGAPERDRGPRAVG
jgi:hypothetical protein